MKKAVVVSVVMLLYLLPGIVRAVTVDFYLTVDVVSHTWTLSASTDAAGGFAAFAVKLLNTETGTSVAPQAHDGDRLKGFQVGNIFFEYPEGHEAFAGQSPLDIDSIVYGIGYTPLPSLAFGKDGNEPDWMIGDASTVPTLLYTGTYDPSGPLPAFAPPPSPNPFVVAALFLEPPPGGYQTPVLPDDIQYNPDLVQYSLSIVPEPGAWLLMAIGVSSVLVLYRRKLRRRCVVA